MLFTTLQFLVFFIIVFVAYWFICGKNVKIQNVLLLVASYVFYGIAEWRMLPLLIITTIVFYWLGLQISKNLGNKKADFFKVCGVVLGVGTLLYFKYFNFFIQSFADLFNAIGLHTNLHTFNIIMPLGVSYFTFKLISYVIEVNRTKMEACKDFVAFANYVSFFPTIMSGPIDRPNGFLAQLSVKRSFQYPLSMEGFQQILWGLFKKVVIADNLAIYVNYVWTNYQTASSSSFIVAMVFYLFQLYADFSGYSDMAIGVAKLMGFKVTPNFHYPFFTTNIAEFWRRWHMSLTSWVTDYVFTPLNIKFRDFGNWGIFWAILINMVIIGLWHGANWTYAVFGVYQALLYIPLIVSGRMNKRQKIKINKIGLPSILDLLKMAGVFLMFAFGTVIIRANDVSHAIDMIVSMFTNKFLVWPQSTSIWNLIFIVLLLLIEWFQKDKEFPLQFSETFYDDKKKTLFIIDLVICFFIITLGYCGSNTFIYFQF